MAIKANINIDLLSPIRFASLSKIKTQYGCIKELK